MKTNGARRAPFKVSKVTLGLAAGVTAFAVGGTAFALASGSSTQQIRYTDGKPHVSPTPSAPATTQPPTSQKPKPSKTPLAYRPHRPPAPSKPVATSTYGSCTDTQGAYGAGSGGGLLGLGAILGLTDNLLNGLEASADGILGVPGTGAGVSTVTVQGSPVCAHTVTWGSGGAKVVVKTVTDIHQSLSIESAGSWGISNASWVDLGSGSAIQGVLATGQQALLMVSKHGVWYIVVCEQVASKVLALAQLLCGGY